MKLAARIEFIVELIRCIILLLVDMVKVISNNFIPYSLKRKKSVKGELVLITGGGSGFGRCLSLKFAKLGAKIVIWDVDEKGSQETKRLVEKEGGKVKCYTLDVSNRELVYATAKLVREEIGDVTILINNAGIGQANLFWETSDSHSKKIMDVNVMAHFWTMKAFLPNMIENNHGHIVGVSSMAGMYATQKLSAYSSSKHAVMGLMDSVLLELIDSGKTGVKTTTACPFFSKTSIFEGVYDGIIPEVKPETVAEEITRAVLTEKEVVCIPNHISLIRILRVITTRKALGRLIKLLSGKSIIENTRIKMAGNW